MTADAETVKRVASKLGLKVVFSETVPGVNPNSPGAFEKSSNTIYINVNTKYPMQQVFLHELTHFFEKADGYTDFQDTVFKSKAFKKWLKTYTEIKKDKYNSIEEYRKELKERYDENDPDEIDREIVAFFVSDNLFKKDFGAVGEIATELNGTAKEKFISFIKNIFKRFRSLGSGIGRLERKFLKLYGSAVQNKNTAKNSGVKQMRDIDSVENDDKVVFNSKTSMSEKIGNKEKFIKKYGKEAVETLNDLAIKLNNNIDVPKSELLNHPIVQDAIERVKNINGGVETYLDDSSERLAIREKVKNKLLALGSFTGVDKNGKIGRAHV